MSGGRDAQIVDALSIELYAVFFYSTRFGGNKGKTILLSSPHQMSL
jgi:hypothetical protein